MQFSFGLATLELRLDICSFGDHQRDETQPSQASGPLQPSRGASACDHSLKVDLLYLLCQRTLMQASKEAAAAATAIQRAKPGASAAVHAICEQ